ncbi:MAG: M56 family metallopeptidase, partial [Planctomycetota bacterium]
MSPVAFLAEHGQELLLGSTLILGAGCLWLLASKAPVHRRRTGVLAIQATLCWLGLALVPLPRLGQVTEPRAASLEGGAGPPPGEGPAFLPEESDLRRPSQLSRPHPEAREMMPGPDLPGQHALPASPVQVEDLAAWLPALYLIGVALCAAWSLIGAILLRRILGTAQALPPSCRGVLRELSRSKREQAIRVRMTKRRLRPFSCGVLRPTVILPAALCAPSRADQLRQVLLHELAHVRAGDGWTQLLLAFARPFLWVHPLYWWLEGRIRLASELLADDWAASQG